MPNFCPAVPPPLTGKLPVCSAVRHLLLGKALEDSMVVDADILYCTELAANLCTRYATYEQSHFCREIAIQQAVRLNDKAALARLQT